MTEYPRDQFPRAFPFTPENCPLRGQGFESYEAAITYLYREYGSDVALTIQPSMCSVCDQWHAGDDREKE